MTMREHVKILGILNIVVGALGFLIVLAVALFTSGVMFMAIIPNPEPEAAAAGAMASGVMGAVLAFALLLLAPGIIGGWGLLEHKPWARILIIVVSALNLLNVPIGTALGAYGLWVLLNRETERLFGVESSAITPVR